mgnify:FL=1
MTSLFPVETDFQEIFDTISFFYITLIQRKANLPLKIVREIADSFSFHVKSQKSNIFIANFINYIYVYLHLTPNITKVIAKYFPTILYCYNFDADPEIRNNIFELFVFSFESMDNEIVYKLINSFPSSGILAELNDIPERRESIFNFLLSAAQKGMNILDYFYNSNFLDDILNIQNDLSFECIKIVYELLIIIVDNDFKDQSKMLNIFIKMIDSEDECFKEIVLDKIDRLCSNMCYRNSLENIMNELCNCGGVEVLEECEMDHPTASRILYGLGFKCYDE